MKIFFQFLLLLITQWGYGSDDCHDALSALIGSSAVRAVNTGKLLKSNNHRDRLRGLKDLENIDPILESILPFVQDLHPQVRIAALRLIQKQEQFQMKAIYELHLQLEREDNISVFKAIEKALIELHERYMLQMYQVWKTVAKHIFDLDSSLARAQEMVRQMDFTEDQWLEMTERALRIKDEDRTEMEKLAVEVYKDVSSYENKFKKVVYSLPFNTSDELLRYMTGYHAVVGTKLRIRSKQTLLIIKKIYSSLKVH